MTTKRYVGYSDRVKGYADLETRFSSYNAKAEGLVLDSIADDRATLNTLANVTMQPNGGRLDVVGVPRIASNITIPANVTLRFMEGAYLAPDVGVTVTINGRFNTRLQKKFGGGGTIVFGVGKVEEAFPEWWGALADGIRDDGVELNASLAACDNVKLMGEEYLTSQQLNVVGAWDASTVRYRGKKLRGAGAARVKIKAAAAYTPNNIVAVGNMNYIADGKFASDCEVSGLTVDNSNMPDSVFKSAVFVMGTFDNTFRDLRLGIAFPFTRWDFNIGDGVYTTELRNVHCGQMQMSSSTVGNITTIKSFNCSATFLNVVNSNSIDFFGFTIQGDYAASPYTLARIQVANCADVGFMNGDLEGSGVMFVMDGCVGVTIEGNNVAMAGSYTKAGNHLNIFYLLTNCSDVKSRGNVFMNWTAGPLASTPGTYLSEPGAANQKLHLNDFNGDFFCGTNYTQSVQQTLVSGVTGVVNFNNLVYETAARVLTSFAAKTYTIPTALVTNPGANWAFVCPIKGVYHVDAALLLKAFAGATDSAYLMIHVNGAEIYRIWSGRENVVLGALQMQIGGDLSCLVGDIISVRLNYTRAGGAPQIEAAATANYVNVKYLNSY